MKKSVSVILICLVLGFVLGFVYERQQIEPTIIERIDTIRDTTVVVQIKKSDRIIHLTDTITEYVKNSDTITLRDTIYNKVYIPTNDYKFENKDASVVVNGYGVELKDFTTFRHTTIVKANPKWSIGVGVGYGLTKDGLSPVVSVSVNRVLFSW